MIYCPLTCCTECSPFENPHTSFGNITKLIGTGEFPHKFPTCLVSELYVNALSVMAHFAEQTTRFLMMPTVFYCCSALIRLAKVFSWIFSKQKEKQLREIFVNEKQNDCEIRIVYRPQPATRNPQPATLSQVFPLAMLSFVICVFHENMRCIRSYIVSLYV